MATHQYACSKDPKKAAKRTQRLAASLQARHAGARANHKPTAYCYSGCDVTRNGADKPDRERWAATKPSTKEGFSGVHIGDYPTLGAACRAIDGFRTAVRG